VARYTARFAAGAIPRPPHWSGFIIVPQEIEFWRDGAFRLHDRVRFARVDGGGWSRTGLFP
jgi:pyridoxamine 5'-phosphate oxidase